MSNLIASYSKYPLKIIKGQGSHVWDNKGKKYLDFYGGHAVCILGHCPKPVLKAIKEQSEKLLFYSNIVETEPQSKLAKLLTDTLKPEKYQVYFSNSGSEANETAIKIARKFTGKKHLISFENSFHGRSISNLGVTGINSYHQFEPNLDKYTTFAKLGDIKSVEKSYTKDTAAVICEAIQSIAGIKSAEKKFYTDLANFCKKKKILLIFDEIQTGLGRTGTFWFAQSLKINPDIITTAKGLASGLPIAATIVKTRISQTIKIGEHGSTFGGGPVPCSAAIATLQEIKKIKSKHQELHTKLKKLGKIKKIHGQGMLIGIELYEKDETLINRCLKQGLIIGSSSDPTVFRLMPPLNISSKEIEEFTSKFAKI